MGNTGEIIVPFVGQKIPFICRFTPHAQPFVCDIQPFVCDGRNQRGFTLIELMITVVVLGILSAIAAPAMRNIVMNNRLATETNDMLVSFAFARSEAVKRSTIVTLCKSLDPSLASPVCDTTSANPWSNGWLIWADTNGNSAFDAGELLRIGDGFSGAGNTIKPSNTAIENEIGFSRLGLLTSAGGSFYICDSRGNSVARVIDISGTGRARLNRDASPACV